MRAGLGIALAALLAASPARAGSSARYALIVGNNVGRSGEGLEPLRHAEREASRLHERLLRYGSFDEARVELVLGQGRDQILAAAKRLADRRQRDAKQLGEVPTLFGFFFSGHGQSGRLLTSGEPLDGKDLSEIVRQVGATMTVGVFDACYSGAIDLQRLRGMGATATPGFNPVAELPREVLDSEGTMWFASSRPGELSYEDDELGGLFTHFFSEAFTAAPADGAGITLESMWEYARRRTAAHAARFGRTQTPEKVVRDLKERGPLYFSFPQERTARIRLHRDLAGTFVLEYAQSALIEQVTKQAGAPLEVATYEGEVTVQRLDEDGRRGGGRLFALGRGAVVTLSPESAPASRRAPGFSNEPIRGKGELPGVVLTRHEAKPLGFAALGYRAAARGQHLVGATHSGVLELGWIRGAATVGLSTAFGRERAEFATWSIRTDELAVGVRGGLGWELGPTRLQLELGAGPSHLASRYASGAQRRTWGAAADAAVRAVAPLGHRILLSARGGLGARWAQGVAVDDRQLHAALAPSLELTLGAALF